MHTPLYLKWVPAQDPGFPGGAGVKGLPAEAGGPRDAVWSLGQEGPLQ